MAGALVESNVHAFWMASQPSGRGTPATIAQKHPIVVAGDLDTNREDGSENFSDLDRFGDATDFVNTIIGGGTLTMQAQTEIVAYVCWLFFANEVFTAKSVGVSPPKYVFTPGTTIGKWATFWKRVGLSTIFRRKFNDCRISSIRFEGSTANKVVKLIPNVVSLDPGEVFATDPTPTIGGEDPFVWTEAIGKITIDGVVYNGASQFAVICDDALAPVYGDAAFAYALATGNAGITLDAITMVLDDVSLARYNTQIYGTAAPTAGTKPLSSIPAIGSYVIEFVRDTLDAKLSLKIEIPGVKWSPDVAIPPNPDGGAIDMAFAGAMRKVAGQPAIRVTVETGASTDVAHTL